MSSSEDKKMAQAEKDKAVAARDKAQEKLEALVKAEDKQALIDLAKEALAEAKKEVEKWDNELIALIRSSAAPVASAGAPAAATAGAGKGRAFSLAHSVDRTRSVPCVVGNAVSAA